jgi:Cu/Ag efflux protein CusF
MSRFAILLLAILPFSACTRTPDSRETSQRESQEPLKQYHMRGVVLLLEPEGHIAKIKNEKIEGWMESMTMDFPVKDPAEFSKLHAGDTIQATVFVQGLEYWVGDVRSGGAAPSAPPAPSAAK